MDKHPEEEQNHGAGQHVSALSAAFIAGVKRPVPQVIEGTGGALVAVPNGYELERVGEEFASRPTQLKKTLTVFKPADAIAYVNRFKNDYSFIELAPEPKNDGVAARITLDYHQPGTQGQQFGHHVVQLKVRTSWQYKLLKALTGGKYPQPQFALALRDLAPYCTSMAPADVLELVRSLNLTSAGKYQTFEDEFSGGVDFQYSVAVRASAGTAQRTITVPQQIAWELPVLIGGKAQNLVTDFIYGVPDGPEGKVTMGLRLNQEAELLQLLAEELGAELVAGTGLLAVTSEF